MRALLPFLLFVPMAVAAACATTSPIMESTGGGSTSVGTPGVTTGAMGGAPAVRGCGMINPDPTCSSCIEASCCSPAQDCAADDSCLACLGQTDPSEDCIVDATFGALEACLADRCSGMCTTGGTSSGTSGGGGGSGGAASTSTTSTASSSATTSSSTSATTTSSSSSTTSSSTSTSSSSSSSSGGNPTTCPGADGDVGCCNASGVLYFCDVHDVLYSQTCGGGSVCGWSTAHGFYDCVAPPGGADPSNTYPLACGGP